MEWYVILPGVYGAIPDPDQQRLRDLQAGGAETHAAYIAFLREMAAHKGLATMKHMAAEFLLTLEGIPGYD